jgi:hypothetical protein
MNDRRPFPDPNPQIFAVNDRVRTMCPGFRHGQAGRITEVIPSVRPCDYSYSITLDDGLKVRTAGEWLQADASPADTSPPDPAKPADSPAGPVVGSSAKPVDSPTSPDPGPLEIRVPWPERFALAASILGGPVESIGPGSGNPDMKILAAPWKLGARYASRLEISGDVASAMFRAVSAVPDFRFALVKVWFEAEHVRHFEAEQGGPVCVPREPDPNGHDRVASDTASADTASADTDSVGPKPQAPAKPDPQPLVFPMRTRVRVNQSAPQPYSGMVGEIHGYHFRAKGPITASIRKPSGFIHAGLSLDWIEPIDQDAKPVEFADV